MPVTKQKKTETVKELDTLLASANSAVFVNFHGLSVANTTILRSKLREGGVGFRVAKKTLLKRALGTKGITGELPVLDGEVALAYGEDLLAPAREVYSFQKEHKDAVVIVGGIFDGMYKAKDEMIAIAMIPPLQTLRGMFVNVINSPIQGFVVGLKAIADKGVKSA